MYACDTNELPAICKEHLKRFEYIHTDDVDMISRLIGLIKKNFFGNGRLMLYIKGSGIEEVESTAKIPTKKRRTA